MIMSELKEKRKGIDGASEGKRSRPLTEEGQREQQRERGRNEEQDSSSNSSFEEVGAIESEEALHCQPPIPRQQQPEQSPRQSSSAATASRNIDPSPSAETAMDPPPQYSPPTGPIPAKGADQQPQQSWFSSSQLPSFLASAAAASSAGDSSQQSSLSAARVLAELRARLQPWGEFFRFSKFGLPPGLTAIGPRLKQNVRHFLTNYLCLFLVLLVYCILTSLLMLLTLIVLAGLCYTIYQRTQKGPILLGQHEVPPSLLYTLALVVCFPLFYLANAGSVMYWVIGAGLFLMLAHASFYASEEVPGQEFEVVTVVAA